MDINGLDWQSFGVGVAVGFFFFIVVQLFTRKWRRGTGRPPQRVPAVMGHGRDGKGDGSDSD